MKKFNYIAFVLIFITALIVRINAATTSYNDIPNNSYVIGTHLYTNEVPLTIKHIMLASNTIEGNTLSDMKLYYKTSRGKWIDGLTGEEKTHLSSYTINYRNSETTSTYYENTNTNEMNKNDIPNNSYVIGSHLYTSEMPLTTNHIMLASRTISENRLSYMKIYYKTSRGKWIDGVSGEEVTVSNSINISHINLEQVTKQAGYITLNETKKTITYGTNTVTFNVVSSHGGTISVVDNNSTSTITKDGNTITVSNLRTIDAGTTITVTVRSAETNAYTEASTTYLITINKADSICPTVTEYSGTYDAKEHTVTVSGGSGGTIKYEKSTNGGTTYTDQGTTNPVRKSAGTTYIRVRIEGDNNHNDKTCDTKTITLAKREVTIKASDQSRTYDGTALEADSTCEITSGIVVSGHKLSCTNTGSQTEVGSSTKTLSTVQVMSGSSDVSSNYTITKTNGTLTVTEAHIYTLSIQYNGNGGIWNNPVKDTYEVNENGTVVLKGTNEVFNSTYNYGESLPETGLVDYNGEYLNWRKSDAGVPPESEYYVINENTNKKTYFNQMNVYTAADIASAAGCNLSKNNCTVVVYVNWEQYLITDADYLKTSGTKFVKSGINGSAGNNNGVVLRGFNIGEWLSRAISLSPMENAHVAFDTSNFPTPYTNLSSAYWREYADNDIQINYILYKRFGKDGEYNLNNIYYKNFITESDIEKMQEIGINAVRVPLAWSYFVDMTYIEPSAPITITSSTKPSDMNAYKYSYTMLTGDRLNQKLEYLDWIVHECRKRGIYVIFDLHVVDGGQSDYGIRPARGFTFYDDQNAQNNAIDIWKIVARRFNGNPGVAGYELLNEPSSGIGGDGNKYIDRPTDRNMYRDELIRFYDMTYKAIRDIDPNHVIIMEAPYHDSKSHQVYMEDSNGNSLLTLPTESERTNGITDASICPATQCKWTNVAYSLHDYFFWSNSVNIIKNDVQSKVAADVRDMKKYNVPIYIGETNFTYTGDNEELDEEVINSSWNYALKQYDNNLFSYTFWSYKVAKSFRFGMVYNLRWNYKNQSMALLLTDDYDTIANKWSMNETDAHYDYVTTYVNILKNNFINNSDKPIINNSTYTCTSDQELISSIKVFSRDGSVTIDNVKTNNSSIADVSFIDPIGVICTSSSCKTIKITCKSAGTVTLTATASNGAQSTSSITVSN